MLPNCCCTPPDCTGVDEICTSWGLGLNSDFLNACPVGPTTVDFSAIDIAGFDADDCLMLNRTCTAFTAVCVDENGAVTGSTAGTQYPNIVETDPIIPFSKLFTNSSGYVMDYYNGLVDHRCNCSQFGCASGFFEPDGQYFMPYSSRCSYTGDTYNILQYQLHKSKFTSEIPSVIAASGAPGYGIASKWTCGADCENFGIAQVGDYLTWDETDSRTLNYHISDGVLSIGSDITACHNSLRPWYTDWWSYLTGCSCVTGVDYYYNNAIVFNNYLINSAITNTLVPYTDNLVCSVCSTVTANQCDGTSSNWHTIGGPCTQEDGTFPCDDPKTPNSNAWTDLAMSSQSLISSSLLWSDLSITTARNTFLPHLADLLIGYVFYWEPSSNKCKVEHTYDSIDQTLSTSSLDSRRITSLYWGKPITVGSDNGIGGGTHTAGIYLTVESSLKLSAGFPDDPVGFTVIHCGKGMQNGQTQSGVIPQTKIARSGTTDVTSLAVEIERFVNLGLHNKIKKVTYYVNDENVYEFTYPSMDGMRLCNDAPIEVITSIISGDFHGMNNSTNWNYYDNYACITQRCGYSYYGTDCTKWVDTASATAPCKYTITAPTITWTQE